MSRLRSSSLVLVWFAAAAACTAGVGSRPGGDDDQGDDGGDDDDVGAIDAAPGAIDAAPGGGDPDAAWIDCDPPALNENGSHNAGTNCTQCHNPSPGGPPSWSAAGTVYAAPSGNRLEGATVHLTSAGGGEVTLVTDALGNFWTLAALTFPLTVEVSRCPSTRAMSATVPGPAPMGCNRSGCHESGMRISLPLP